MLAEQREGLKLINILEFESSTFIKYIHYLDIILIFFNGVVHLMYHEHDTVKREHLQYIKNGLFIVISLNELLNTNIHNQTI